MRTVRIAIFAAVVLIHAVTLPTLEPLRTNHRTIVRGPVVLASIIDVQSDAHALGHPKTTLHLKPVRLETESIAASLPHLAAYDPNIESPVDLAALPHADEAAFEEFNAPPRPDPRFPLVPADGAYQPSAGEAREEGTVTVLVLVRADGSIAESRIDRSSGIARLDEAAVQYASRLHLTPGRRNGHVLSMWLSVELSFRTERSFARFLGPATLRN